MSVDALLRMLPEHPARISADITAFDEAMAVGETARFRDPARWEDLDVDPRWAVIGGNDHGDTWLLGPDGGVWFFDSNHGLQSAHLFEALRIDITEWLVLAHALRTFERIPDASDDDVMRLDMMLESISPGLGDRYPYPLPFA